MSDNKYAKEEKRLFELYDGYSSERLRDITYSPDEYTAMAVKVAKEILEKRGDNDISNVNETGEWYYVKKGEKVGPVLEEYIIEEVKDNRLSYDTLVWKRGMDSWKTVDESSIGIKKPVFKENWLSYICLLIITCTPIINSFWWYLVDAYGMNAFIRILGFVQLIFWSIDSNYLKKYGIRGKWKLWVIFPPVYLLLRAKKTNKNYAFGIVSVVVSVICIVGMILNERIENENNTVRNNMLLETTNIEMTTGIVKDDSAIERYEFEKEGVIEVQEDIVDSVDLLKYIPTPGEYTYAMEVNQKQIKSSEKIIWYENEYYFERYSSNGVITSEGNYSYDEDYDCLYENCDKNVLGKSSISILLIQPDKVYNQNDGTKLASPPSLFTVTTEAGVFKDCACMIEIKEETEGDYVGTYTTVKFYAPQVGLVLDEDQSPLTKSTFKTEDYVVSNELIEIID